jgi:hypothetical protein
MRNIYWTHMSSTAIRRPIAFVLLLAALIPAGSVPALHAQGHNSREQDAVRENMLDRKVMPFSILKRRVEQEMGDEASYVGTAPPPRTGVYRMQFLRPDGQVIWVDVDGKSGEIIARTRTR